ncbi:peptidoglycan-binding protein [Streptomyces prunicolor]|uniref:peptidoglycan-binding protein n=1 Tax=Streptomyces prunicolor TaxID=67348 RepID=UPI00224F48B3|nr:peptidoglycan-binding protein [Streptomyces prunicolor]MCX5238699.1 peptidoglycan-binding protein [Streptomyces prunicolor]
MAEPALAHEEETSEGEHGDSTAVTPRAVRRPHRTRRLLVALAVLAAVAGAAAAGLGLGDRASDAGAKSQLPPATATVTRQTLKDSRTEDGSLGYGTSTSAVGRVPGTVTHLPETGERISRGAALYRVDDDPVVLMYGAVPAYRALRTGEEGADVKELERNLKALGYGGFTVDDSFTDATADAVKEWQDDQGLDQTGAVELGRVVFASSAVRVDALGAEEGAAIGPGQKVLSYTATAQAVTVELDTADQRLARQDSKVTVELPDGTVVDGRVSEVSTEIIPGSGPDEDPTTKVKVLVALDGTKAQRAAASYVLASVHVSFTAGEREDVLTVPVAALVALSDGGFGVQVVRGTGSAYVPVGTGLFANGRVEISGTGISAGTKVGMPA